MEEEEIKYLKVAVQDACNDCSVEFIGYGLCLGSGWLLLSVPLFVVVYVLRAYALRRLQKA